MLKQLDIQLTVGIVQQSSFPQSSDISLSRNRIIEFCKRHLHDHKIEPQNVTHFVTKLDPDLSCAANAWVSLPDGHFPVTSYTFASYNI